MKRKSTVFFIIALLMIAIQCIGGIQVDAKETDHEQQWWWNKDKQTDEKPPELKGGPEEDHRQQEPVSMQELQQQYPDIVMLQGPTTGNQIALTFDDGPDPRFTPQILETLNKHGVPATFFVMGARVEAYPDLARQMYDEGHVIGNHTFWHPDLVEEGETDVLVNEVRTTEQMISDVIGIQTTLFRPPYGFLYEELVEELDRLQYSVIGWSVDSLDWQEEPPEVITEKVVSETHPGAIILMHDGADAEGDRTGTIEAIDQIIPQLQEQGYEFVTVPQLLNIPYER